MMFNIQQFMNVLDAKDVQAYSDFFTEDAIFKFGNMEAIQGREQIFSLVDSFLGSIDGIKHHLSESWTIDNTIISHGMVTYLKLDDSELSVPFSLIAKISNRRIFDYQIFINNSELFN